VDLTSGLGRRVAVLGGTFDPVHNGHLAMAEAVRSATGADVLFIPAAQPPHKLDYAITPFEQRVAMLACAIADQPGYFLSRLEEERLGPSYSIDTLRTLAAGLREGTELFFVVGMDSFEEIASWKQYQGLVNFAHLLVIGRPDQCHLDMQEIVVRDFPFFIQNSQDRWRAQEIHGEIRSIIMEPVPVSSTEIRSRIRAGDDCSLLVPEKVMEYIREHNLYR
jgi:nicotinate-nucleotide adenylyltransferase